jgi:DNA-binding FrmR family transcriptional regulator
MLKKSVVTFIVIVLFASTGVLAEANAVSISNGSACVKAGVSTTVKVKGASKLYVCTGNPSQAGFKALEWTLKTCVSYWAAAQNSQDSINQQRSLVSSMSEPDKSTYTKQLNASQAQLDRVKSAIVSNHCKKGL